MAMLAIRLGMPAASMEAHPGTAVAVVVVDATGGRRLRLTQLGRQALMMMKEIQHSFTDPIDIVGHARQHAS